MTCSICTFVHKISQRPVCFADMGSANTFYLLLICQKIICYGFTHCSTYRLIRNFRWCVGLRVLLPKLVFNSIDGSIIDSRDGSDKSAFEHWCTVKSETTPTQFINRVYRFPGDAVSTVLVYCELAALQLCCAVQTMKWTHWSLISVQCFRGDEECLAVAFKCIMQNFTTCGLVCAEFPTVFIYVESLRNVLLQRHR